jgi:LmbE family N-acetylglucosaminyl deacetylase
MPTQAHATVTDLGIVLGVWAHPDDEAYLSAGLMALVAETGGQVVCVTATRGERGTADPESWPPQRLGALREQELAESLSILGVEDHRWLSHADGECETVPQDQGMAEISAIIGDVRPDTVVTFGPDGMTGHRDHITVGDWTTIAAHKADHRPRVLHAAVDDSIIGALDHTLSRLGIYGPQGPPRVARHEAAVVLDLPEHTLDQKVAALRAQASQTGQLIEDMGESTYRQWISVEAFVEAPATI